MYFQLTHTILQIERYLSCSRSITILTNTSIPHFLLVPINIVQYYIYVHLEYIGKTATVGGLSKGHSHA